MREMIKQYEGQVAELEQRLAEAIEKGNDIDRAVGALGAKPDPLKLMDLDNKQAAILHDVRGMTARLDDMRQTLKKLKDQEKAELEKRLAELG